MKATEIKNKVEKMVTGLKSDVQKLRRIIHEYPELSFDEYRTSELIYNKLRELPGLIVTRPTATSVLAVLKGGQEGKVIALRSDMDALALEEENDVPYKSKHPGIMHACGHDGHVAMLLAAAKILSALQKDIKGEIRFIFQHAEEKHPGGARELVAAGVLQRVDVIIAAHLWVPLAVGKVGLAAGPVMAAPDNFVLEIKGKGGHAARPQEAVDPILVSAYVISSLQSIVSRQNDPLNPLVLSITNMHAGTAYNIIPKRAELKGTVRTFNPETRNSMPGLMENIIQGTCSAFGAGYSFSYELGYDPVINDDSIVSSLRTVLEANLGVDSIEKITPVMGGEDFSAYLQKIPGVMLFIGAGNEMRGITQPHHHPRFEIDEDAFPIGIKVLVWAALGLLDVV